MANKKAEYEKVRKSLQTAEDRISAVRKRLSELGSEMERLLVVNEVKGRKNRAIRRTQAEIEDLRQEEILLEAKISALRKSLPEIEKQARIEIAKKGATRLYQESKKELTELLQSVPSVDSLRAEIAKIKQHGDLLEDAKTRFLSTSKEIANLMTSENLDKVGAVTMNSLRNDRNIDYSQVLQVSDSLIDLSKNINRLQYELFNTCTNNPLEFFLPTEPKPEPEISSCGRFKIQREGDSWSGYIKETHFANGVASDSWKRIRSTKDRITFEELREIVGNMKQKERERLAKEKIYQ